MSRYCVVALNVSNRDVPRHWKDTPEEAIEHAEELMATRFTSPSQRLVVVEAKYIIERRRDTDVRAPRDADFLK